MDKNTYRLGAVADQLLEPMDNLRLMMCLIRNFIEEKSSMNRLSSAFSIPLSAILTFMVVDALYIQIQFRQKKATYILFFNPR